MKIAANKKTTADGEVAHEVDWYALGTLVARGAYASASQLVGLSIETTAGVFRVERIGRPYRVRKSCFRDWKESQHVYLYGAPAEAADWSMEEMERRAAEAADAAFAAKRDHVAPAINDGFTPSGW